MSASLTAVRGSAPIVTVLLSVDLEYSIRNSDTDHWCDWKHPVKIVNYLLTNIGA